MAMGAHQGECVTTRKLVAEIVQIVRRRRLSELCCNAIGQRVAADTREVLAQQARRPDHIARGGQADDFDVMAFPCHLTQTRTSGRCSGDRTEIGLSEFE